MAQKRVELELSLVTTGRRDLWKIIPQPPKGLPTIKLEQIIPLTPTEQNCELKSKSES